MASRLTPIGWITKFLVVPAALAAVGFYVIGPRIGAPDKSAPKKVESQDDSGGITTADAPSAPSSNSPSVQNSAPDGAQVTVHPARTTNPTLGQDSDATSGESPTAEDNPKPRVRRRSVNAAGRPIPNLIAPPTDPTPDDGGSAGGIGAPPATGTTSGTTTGDPHTN